MKYIESKLFKFQIFIQAILLLVFFIFNINSTLQSVFCGLLLCTVGIPHGANDYLFSTDKSIKGLIKFLAIYLTAIGLYMLVWWYLPIFALIIFFLISFHHFGQSNLENDKLLYLPSLFWGLWIIGFPVLLHFEEALSIFNEMINVGKPTPINNTSVNNIYAWQIYSAITIAICYLFSIYYLKRKYFLNYLIQFVLVSIWYILTPLIFGFIVAFCLWHALQSIRHQSNFYTKNFAGNQWNFIKAMLPFSLIALAFFLGYLYLFGFNLGEAFILLSLITLPHVLVMDKLYFKT
jgi:beta-carotene 15,15'-dioxygenase